jgi:hypothetical protein
MRSDQRFRRSPEQCHSQDEAAKRFDDAQTKLQQTKDQAVQTAKNAADASTASASKAEFAASLPRLAGPGYHAWRQRPPRPIRTPLSTWQRNFLHQGVATTT